MVVKKNWVDEVFRTKEKLDRHTADMFLKEAYQMTYGIFDHIGQVHKENIDKSPGSKRPLSIIAKHRAESFENTHLTAFLKRYAESNVFEIFHLTVTELLQYPRATVEEIFKITEIVSKNKVRGIKDIEKSLNNVIGK